ncbi:MAG: GerAB/ArcD/ProY family transporter [Clostridiales bacterium]|nr:GerAB/ArcD/ProY family transporter [Clostridiales bacterium]
MKKSQMMYKHEFIVLLTSIISLNAMLTFPLRMTQLAGTASWLLAVVILLFAFIGVVILHKLYEPFVGKDILDVAMFTWGRKLQVPIALLALAQVLYGGIVVARQFGESLNIIALPNSPIGFVIFLLMLGSGIVACQGLKTVARVAFIFYKVVSGGILLILLGVIDKFKIINLFPLLGLKNGITIKNGFVGISWFSGILAYFLFIPFLDDKEKGKEVLYKTVGISGLFMFLVTLVYQGVFSYPASKKQFIPLYSLSRSIQQGGKIERIEAIFFIIWVISALTFIAVAALVSAYIFRRLFDLKYSKPIILCMIVIIFSVSLMYKNIIGEETYFVKLYRRVSYITSYIVPMLLFALANVKNRKVNAK